MYNILIRPLIESDAGVSWRWRNDPEVWKYTGSRPDIEVTEDIERDWIKKVINDTSSRRFAILVDEEYVGNIQLTEITDRDAEYHIFIGNKAYWGKGVAQAATYQLLFFAKEILHLAAIRLSVDENNTAAVKVYEKTGFNVTSHEGGKIIMSCALQKLSPPHVSVFMMVYNHEPFLRQSLDSILQQKCLFSTVLVIGDDCSSDGSRAILKEYAQKYPGKFKLLLHEQNVGAIRNQESVLKACDGDYISVCEGDDYWTDSCKLQKQVDFMDANPDYVLCSHYREVLENGTFEKQTEHIYSQCMLFRNVLTEDFFEHARTVFNGDTFLHKYLSLKGKTKILDFYGAVYRINIAGGVYSSINNIMRLKHGINTFNHLLQLKDSYHDDNALEVFKGIVEAQSTYYMSLIYLQIGEKQRKEAFSSYLDYIKFGLKNGQLLSSNFWKNNLRYFYYLVKH